MSEVKLVQRSLYSNAITFVANIVKVWLVRLELSTRYTYYARIEHATTVAYLLNTIKDQSVGNVQYLRVKYLTLSCFGSESLRTMVTS